MFAKHLAKIDNKTFSFSIWDIEKMLPTKVVVGGKTRINRMYKRCAFMQIGLLNNEEDAEIKKPSATNPPFKGRRKYKRAKKILSTQRLVEFLSEH
tara:strand:- start:374 stop:661 length:288 start_codon:yes stop_codon:yes gene_type:complete